MEAAGVIRGYTRAGRPRESRPGAVRAGRGQPDPAQRGRRCARFERRGRRLPADRQLLRHDRRGRLQSSRCWCRTSRATSASCTRPLFKLPGVTHVRSSVVLKEVKAETGLPLEQVAQPAAPARGQGLGALEVDPQRRRLARRVRRAPVCRPGGRAVFRCVLEHGDGLHQLLRLLRRLAAAAEPLRPAPRSAASPGPSA